MINTFKSLYTFIKTELKWCFYKLRLMGVSLPDKFQYLFLLSKVKEIPNNIKFYPTAVSFDNSKEVDLLESVDMINTSSVTSMKNMFYRCSLLQKLNLKDWDTTNVTSMYYMFNGCSSLQLLDISGWDTTNVTSMYYMFNGCSSLRQIIGNDALRINENMTSISGMFYNCSSLLILDVSNWDTSNITNMSYMFYNCSSLLILDVSNWDVSLVTSFNAILNMCKSLRSLIGNHTLEDVRNGLVAMKGASKGIRIWDSNIRFSSLLALAKGLADLTGADSLTLSLKRADYNNMYNDDDTIPTADVIAERLAELSTICSEKNWTLTY